MQLTGNDDSWFARLAALTGLVGRVSAMIGVLMVAAVFLVIGNSVRLSIFARRDSINVQKLIGATDGFILRPFLYGGALLGFSGALLSLILSEILVLRLSSAVAEVAQVFGTKFDINGLSFDECLLLLLVCSMNPSSRRSMPIGHMQNFQENCGARGIDKRQDGAGKQEG